MTRYFRAAATPRGWVQEMPDLYPQGTVPSITVHDIEARGTGLVDGEGVPIMAGPDPVGFLRGIPK